jgi:putative ABC transport system permease protein
MAILQLTWRSLWNRRGTALLTILAIAVSVALLLGVQKMRTAARDGFADTVSGVDLIVGARSGPLNLLLYSVFRVGDATANVSWSSYQKIAHHRDVAWTIPISLGDGHRGFRVMGTNGDYFLHYQFAGDRMLQFSAGAPFSGSDDAVLGAEVARSLGYHLGDEIIVGHGLGAVSFAEHKDSPFHVVGILKPTGTPVDRTVHVSLEAISAIHHAAHEAGVEPDLTPDSITAFLVRMKDPVMLLQMQRAVNEYRPEALLAIVPGVALMQLWDVVGIADRALMVVAAFVVLAGLLGMLIAILTSLNERRREMAILRSVGAGPGHVFGLLVAEAGVLATLGVATGVALAFALLAIAQPIVARRFGLFLRFSGLSATDLAILAAIIGAALLMGLVPAWRAYRNALSDGLIPRV